MTSRGRYEPRYAPTHVNYRVDLIYAHLCLYEGGPAATLLLSEGSGSERCHDLLTHHWDACTLIQSASTIAYCSRLGQSGEALELLALRPDGCER